MQNKSNPVQQQKLVRGVEFVIKTNFIITADNQLNAKPVIKQRHTGDEFPVSQRGSTKGKQSQTLAFESR